MSAQEPLFPVAANLVRPAPRRERSVLPWNTDESRPKAMKQLSPAKDAATRVLKITRQRITAALHELEKSEPDDESLHAARKSLKRARTGLRLLRPGLKDGEYRRANASLRDAARPLGVVRDARVLQDTLACVVQDSQHAKRVQALEHLLRRGRRESRRELLHDKRILAHSRRLLRATLARMADWKLRKSDWKLLGPALEHAYEKAKRARGAARAAGTPAALHEWRKQVKYLRYALEILEPVWPAMVGALENQARKLSDDLGDSHDLTALCEVTVAHPDALRTPGDLEALLALTERQQQAAMDEAKLIGSRLFDEKPRAFAARLGRYWRYWRQDAGVL